MKRYIYISAAFFTLLVFSCGEVSDFEGGGGSGGGYDALCGDKGYKTAEQFCLNDEIYSLCGGKAYDIAKEFCHSDGSVNIRCNGNMYNPVSYFCFDSKTYSKCGVGDDAQIYNPKELFCYDNVLDTLCNGVKFDPKSYFCSHEDYKVHLFCGGKKYNPDLEICFGKTDIYNICPSGNFANGLANCCSKSSSNCKEYQLCGDAEEYNVTDQFCYEEKIYDKCGGLTYDPAKKICRYEKLNELCRVQTGVDDFGRPQFEDFPYDPETQKCGSNGIEDKEMPPKCPSLLDTQFCCFGKAYPKDGDYFCYKDELYPICIENTKLPPSDSLYRPRPSYKNDSTTQYNPVYEGCFKEKLYPRCTRDDVVGSCVDKTIKRCKQLGSGETYVIDPLPGMTCNDSTGAITGTSNSGIPIAQIGSQVWMRENLDSTLHDWATAMKIDASYNTLLYSFPSDRPWQGPCPAGFYLPTDVDWEKLRVYAGGTFIAGGRLKIEKDSTWLNNGKGINAYGFDALPRGYGNGVNQGPSEVGTRAMWWSVTQAANVENASYWTIISSDTEFRTHNQSKGLNKAHIRCLHY
jgi:uncharacterized protein (TIGR02145 family)